MKLNNLHQARVSLSLVPLAQCFTLNLVKRRTFCTMDLPQTLESKIEKSTNKHETFEFPQDLCPNKDSPEFISLSTMCFHQDRIHLLILLSKMYRRVVVDAFVYRKHNKFCGSTMELILQLQMQSTNGGEGGNYITNISCKMKTHGRAHDHKRSTTGR